MPLQKLLWRNDGTYLVVGGGEEGDSEDLSDPDHTTGHVH